MSTLVGLHTLAPVSAPVIAPDFNGGSMTPGTYDYLCTYFNGWGETDPGPSTSFAVTPGAAQLTLPISPDPNCVGRKIYRTTVGVTTPFLLDGVVHDNTTTTYIDTKADADLGTPAPISNTAKSTAVVIGGLEINESLVMATNTTTAAGTNAATAALLSSMALIHFITGGDGVKGVKLPRDCNQVNSQIIIKNTSTGSILVYPYGASDTIDGAASTTIGAGASSTFIIQSIDPIAWTVLNTIAGGTPAPPTASEIIYVNKAGDDATGDGSFVRPFLTVQAALASITDGAVAKRYVVEIGPGIYTGTIHMKAFVSLHGSGTTVTTLDCDIDIVDPSWAATNAIGQISYLQAGTATTIRTITIDLAAQSADNATFVLFECLCFGAYSVLSTPTCSLAVQNSFILNTVTVDGVNTFINNLIVGPISIVDSANPAVVTQCQFAGCIIFVGMTVTNTNNVSHIQINLQSTYPGAGGLTTVGDCDVQATSDSLPQLSLLNLSGPGGPGHPGTTLNKVNDLAGHSDVDFTTVAPADLNTLRFQAGAPGQWHPYMPGGNTTPGNSNPTNGSVDGGITGRYIWTGPIVQGSIQFHWTGATATMASHIEIDPPVNFAHDTGDASEIIGTGTFTGDATGSGVTPTAMVNCSANVTTAASVKVLLDWIPDDTDGTIRASFIYNSQA
jgi:hypothetical protein